MTMSITHDPSIRLQPTANGITVPAPGRWEIHTSSFLGMTSRGATAVRESITAGTLVVGATDDEPLHLDLATTSRHIASMTARAERVDPGSDGFARYHLSGRFDDADGRQHPLEIVLAFHGVYRRRGDAWGWFSGASTGRRSTWQRRPAQIVLDLIVVPGHVLLGTSRADAGDRR